MKTMNDEADKRGREVKQALETASSGLVLNPQTRRTVIAAAERRSDVGWSWFPAHKVLLARAACALILLGVILQVARKEGSHHPEPYMQIHAEVYGGQMDTYWRRRTTEIRTRNGREGYIRIEAEWPKQTSAITPNMRRET